MRVAISLLLLLLLASTGAASPLEDTLPLLVGTEPATDARDVEAPTTPEVGVDAGVPGLVGASLSLSTPDLAPSLDVSLPLLGLRVSPDPPTLDLLPRAPAAGADPPLLPVGLAWPGGPGGAGAGDEETRDAEDTDTLEGVERPAPDGGEVGVLSRGPATPPEHDRVGPAVAVGASALLAILGRLYSRFERRDVLRSDARARIHALVNAKPGATLADLARETALGRGALVHHCQMLARHGLLTSRHDGLHRRFYPGGARLDAAPRPPTASERRVLDLLAAHGPLTQGEMAARLGVTPQAVSYHVVRLARLGRVLADDAGGQRRWLAASAETGSGGQERPVDGLAKTMTDIG